MNQNWVTADSIREGFSQAMSAMYQQEVPQYGTLLKLVAQVNDEVLSQQPALRNRLASQDELARLNVERHGAIRVGSAGELNMLRRLFAVMGMFPVGYYDLSQAGVPVHSTAFRPVERAALKRNPFRLFTSLLRLELIESQPLRAQARQILAKRDIFTPQCRALLQTCEQQGGLDEAQAQSFIRELLETFRWHGQTTVDGETYRALAAQHRLIADVVCFPGCHINHLTPRTLDIDRVQALMPSYGITPKALIEGPPCRDVPLLLRQTSFKALEEPVRFHGGEQGAHTARFGEIEQRGVALTAKGRALYDGLLREAGQGEDNLSHQRRLSEVFSIFPHDEITLRQQGLAFFQYYLTGNGRRHPERLAGLTDPQRAIDQGLLSASPMIYEDFLPVSAAGIFQSNLADGPRSITQGAASREQFEQALGAQVIDEIALYEELQQQSLAECLGK